MAITPRITFDGRLNELSGSMEALDRKVNKLTEEITVLEETLNRGHALLLDIAKCQIPLIEEYLGQPEEHRDFGVLKERCWSVIQQKKEEHKLGFQDLLDARKYTFEDGHSVELDGEKKRMLLEDFDGRWKEHCALGYKLPEEAPESSFFPQYKVELEAIVKDQEFAYEYHFDRRTEIATESLELQSTFAPFYREMEAAKEAIIEQMRGLTSLNVFSAAQIGDIAFIQQQLPRLIGKTSFLNKTNQDDERFTMLHFAAFNHKPAVVEFLHKQGADLKNEDAFGYQAIHWAAKAGAFSTINYLLDHKVDISAKGEFDRTPLHMSVYEGKVAATRLLLERGANINAQTNVEDGATTPLMNAVNKMDLKMVETLCSFSQLDVTITNRHGISALQMAQEMNSPDLLRLIENHQSAS